MTGLMFEPHPPNFENLYKFKDVQMMLEQFFDISTGFRFSKLQWGSVTVAFLVPHHLEMKKSTADHLSSKLHHWGQPKGISTM